MKNLSEKKSLILLIVCGVLLLALIVVSAFAYQWHNDKKVLRNRVMTLQAKESFSDTAITDLGNQEMQIASLNAEIETYTLKIKEYEKILTENDLMPE